MPVKFHREAFWLQRGVEPAERYAQANAPACQPASLAFPAIWRATTPRRRRQPQRLVTRLRPRLRSALYRQGAGGWLPWIGGPRPRRGTSTGGVCPVSGIFSQPDVGPPTHVGGNLCPPAYTGGYTLQRRVRSLVTPNSAALSDQRASLRFTEPAPVGNRFYRLRKP